MELKFLFTFALTVVGAGLLTDQITATYFTRYRDIQSGVGALKIVSPSSSLAFPRLAMSSNEAEASPYLPVAGAVQLTTQQGWKPVQRGFAEVALKQ